MKHIFILLLAIFAIAMSASAQKTTHNADGSKTITTKKDDGTRIISTIYPTGQEITNTYHPNGLMTTTSKMPCAVCLGTAKCRLCGGSGWTYNIYGPIYCPGCWGLGSCTSCNGLGFLTFTSSSFSAPNPTPNATGGSFNSMPPQSPSSSYPSDNHSSSRRTCPGCGGTGKGMERIEYAPNYTGKDNAEYCAKCGRVMSRHSHIQQTCRVCYGKGYVE